ncbi:unnamed protein product, partial [Polarella glacialis]
MAKFIMNRMAAGHAHSLIVTERREVIAWGCNSHGQVGTGDFLDKHSPQIVLPGSSEAKSVAANRSTSLCMTYSGELFAWGCNEDALLGIGTMLPKIPNPTKVDTLGHRIAYIAAGGKHNMAVTEEGRLLIWGSNEYGQLGDGTTRPRLAPGLLELPGDVRC